MHLMFLLSTPHTTMQLLRMMGQPPKLCGTEAKQTIVKQQHETLLFPAEPHAIL